jgi:hypothetical protein
LRSFRRALHVRWFYAKTGSQGPSITDEPRCAERLIVLALTGTTAQEASRQARSAESLQTIGCSIGIHTWREFLRTTGAHHQIVRTG